MSDVDIAAPLAAALGDPAFAASCPAQRAIDQLADKWKLRILLELSRDGVVRFRELQRRLEGVSQKVLTHALRELEADGLVSRTVYPEVPPRVEYRPTMRSQTLMPILAQLHAWAAAHDPQPPDARG